MDENKIVNVKALLYDADTDEVKRIISQTEDQEIQKTKLIMLIYHNGILL